MRTLRNTALVVTATAALALPGQAAATPGHSFSGRCDVLGRTVTTSNGMFSEYETYSGTGTCTGRLDGDVKLHAYHVRVTTLAALGMVQGPSVSGDGVIRFVNAGREIHWSFTRHAGGVLDIHGSQGTRAVGLRSSKAADAYGVSIQAPTALTG